MLGAAVCAALLGTIAPIITGLLVDLAIPQANRGLMLQMGLGLLVCTVASAAFGLAQSLLSLRVESLADATTQAAVWDRVLSLKPLFFRGYASGDLNARIMGITEIRRRLSGVTLRSLFSGFFSLVNLVFMFACSPSLTWIALGLALVVVVVTIGHGRLKLPRVKALQKIQGEIFGLTVQLINGIAKLRVAGAEERAFAHWAETYSRQQKLNFDIQFIEDSLAGLTQVLPLISSFLIFWCTYALLPDRAAQATGQLAPFSLGAFLAFNAAFNIFIRGVASLSTTVVDALDVINLWERALPILEAEPEVNADSEDPGRLGGRLALEKLSFRYVKGGPLILDHLSIHAEPGEFIALVGDSGCGKSTIFRLLLGFETPEAGSITYDNQDLSRLDVRSVRRQLGVVLQNGKVQSGSIFQNIAKGAVISLDEAWEAARLAGLEDDIRRMPMGMNTVVSEGGGNISGGQRQRLLIAQALCLRPSVLLLDEATSALDNRTQSIVSESLARLQVTRVVVAHRLSTIRSADRIYVLQRGRIVQQGRYEELIAQEGLFAQLASRQLA
jgi:NHLM bacteriocin system ABC transporter ATP-binding protein